jgi:hypothetical protein
VLRNSVEKQCMTMLRLMTPVKMPNPLTPVAAAAAAIM